MLKTEKPTRLPKKEADAQKNSSYIKKGGNGGARENAGRPAFEPTDVDRKQVEALAGYGVPFEQIAVLIHDGISLDTLRTYFASELIRGKAKANAQIGKGIYQKAIGGDTTAMIWWSKTQMRWSEVQKHEHTSPDGTMSPGALGDAVLAALARKHAE